MGEGEKEKNFLKHFLFHGSPAFSTSHEEGIGNIPLSRGDKGVCKDVDYITPALLRLCVVRPACLWKVAEPDMNQSFNNIP